MTNAKKSEVLQGTLDLMILKTLHALGVQHGFGIARRIEQVSRDVLQLNEGKVYTSLLRLLQQGWIAAEWGTSDGCCSRGGSLRSGGRPTTTARPSFTRSRRAARSSLRWKPKIGSGSRA